MSISTVSMHVEVIITKSLVFVFDSINLLLNALPTIHWAKIVVPSWWFVLLCWILVTSYYLSCFSIQLWEIIYTTLTDSVKVLFCVFILECTLQAFLMSRLLRHVSWVIPCLCRTFLVYFCLFLRLAYFDIRNTSIEFIAWIHFSLFIASSLRLL